MFIFFNVSEDFIEEFKAFHVEVNLLLEKKGFGKDFYRIYKAKGRDLKSFKYFRISDYTSDKQYEITHVLGEEYQKIRKPYNDND